MSQRAPFPLAVKSRRRYQSLRAQVASIGSHSSRYPNYEHHDISKYQRLLHQYTIGTARACNGVDMYEYRDWLWDSHG